MSDRLDSVVIGNYAYIDKAMITTGGVVHNFKLALDGRQCCFHFLEHYFRNGRDLPRAREAWARIPGIAHSPTFLNGVYLADLLRSRLGFRVGTINNFAEEKDRLERFLAKGPRYAILSSSLIIYPRHVSEIVEFVKERVPGIRVVVGGTKLYKSFRIRERYDAGQLDDFPREWFDDMHYFFGGRKDRADYYVVNSRGESALLALLAALENGEDPRGLPSLACPGEDGGMTLGEVRPEPYLLSDHSIDWSRVDDGILGFEVPVTLKQGCPYTCAFCDFVGLERKMVNRNRDCVAAELRSIRERVPGKSVCFVDENLFLNKEHLKDFCAWMVREKFGLRWRGFTRVSVIDKETAAILKEAGCYSMALGVESGDPVVLRNMNKKITPGETLEAIRALNRAGINTYSTLFVGFPGETQETVGNTIDLLNSYPTDEGGINFYSVNAFLVLPLSPVSRKEMREKFGLTGYFDRWRHDTMDSEEAVRQVRRLFLEVRNCFFVYLDSDEVTRLDGTLPQHRTIVQCRQRIVQNRIAGAPPEENDRLWDRMEQAFAELGSLRGTTSG